MMIKCGCANCSKYDQIVEEFKNKERDDICQMLMNDDELAFLAYVAKRMQVGNAYSQDIRDAVETLGIILDHYLGIQAETLVPEQLEPFQDDEEPKQVTRQDIDKLLGREVSVILNTPDCRMRVLGFLSLTPEEDQHDVFTTYDSALPGQFCTFALSQVKQIVGNDVWLR